MLIAIIAYIIYFLLRHYIKVIKMLIKGSLGKAKRHRVYIYYYNNAKLYFKGSLN